MKSITEEQSQVLFIIMLLAKVWVHIWFMTMEREPSKEI
jgi:hypothetical protein